MDYVWHLYILNLDLLVKMSDAGSKVKLTVRVTNTRAVEVPMYTTYMLKIQTIEEFKAHYDKFITDIVSEVTTFVNDGRLALHDLDEHWFERCSGCAYWNGDSDCVNTATCTYWDLPERPCVTAFTDYCSVGYAPKEDPAITEVSRHDAEPIKPKAYTLDSRHTYLMNYINELGTKPITEVDNSRGTNDLLNLLMNPCMRLIDKQSKD